MFKSAKLFFIYLAWFVGIILIISGTFNLVIGLIYQTVPTTQKAISYGGGMVPFPLSLLIGSTSAIFEEDMMYQPQNYLPMPYQMMGGLSDLSKLSTEERKAYDEAYKKAEKKAEEAKKKAIKNKNDYIKAMTILTLAKGIVGLLLGIPLMVCTWMMGKREKNSETVPG